MTRFLAAWEQARPDLSQPERASTTKLLAARARECRQTPSETLPHKLRKRLREVASLPWTLFSIKTAQKEVSLRDRAQNPCSYSFLARKASCSPCGWSFLTIETLPSVFIVIIDHHSANIARKRALGHLRAQLRECSGFRGLALKAREPRRQSLRNESLRAGSGGMGFGKAGPRRTWPLRGEQYFPSEQESAFPRRRETDPFVTFPLSFGRTRTNMPDQPASRRRCCPV